MEFYILKSGICLAIFYSFYKLVLEKESFHVFKRYYLLVSAVLAFVIPLITFTEYIEVIPQEVPLFFPESSITHTVIEAEPINYMPIILWSLYGLGMLLFSFKFLKNLSGIIFRIKRNPKFKNQSFINVLLQDLVIPHTFLSYIFLNKHKFETQQIPKEVLLHEETHAKQKHSLDVLFIELLQILFWFNPFIYFIKRSIKLNHEFLADQAVINNGVTPSTYQQILLAFSSNASEPQLANAINYSSIKKRFTVMNTHTSKQAFWLRSLILLPLLALLIYSFSEKKIVEKPQVFKIVNGEIKVHITKDKKVIIDNETIDFNSISDKLLELTKEETIKPTVQINVEGEVDTEYLEKIKNELKESNLDISTISAKSIRLDEKNDNYLKVNKSLDRINYVADSIVVIGNLRAKYITVFQLDSNSKNIKVDKLKTNQSLFSINKKGEVVAQKMQKATLEEKRQQVYDERKKANQQKSKTGNDIYIAINEKGIVIVNKYLVQIRDLKEFLNDLTKDLTKEEKGKIVVTLVSYEAPN
ncbi:MAG: M56 family metallopeptidase, partial [Flavobacteriales bacterium]